MTVQRLQAQAPRVHPHHHLHWQHHCVYLEPYKGQIYGICTLHGVEAQQILFELKQQLLSRLFDLQFYACTKPGRLRRANSLLLMHCMI